MQLPGPVNVQSSKLSVRNDMPAQANLLALRFAPKVLV
jgi:hypothetical protein